MAAIGGEWYIGPGDGYPADPGTKRFVYATQPDGERYIVAKVWSDGEDYESTARLVAAAPALLSACLRLMEYWQDGTPVDGGSEVADLVFNAVSKAGGWNDARVSD